MKTSIWDEKGEAVLRRDGTLHHPKSKEGRRIIRRAYGRNSKNIERTGSIYDEDGYFYLG